MSGSDRPSSKLSSLVLTGLRTLVSHGASLAAPPAQKLAQEGPEPPVVARFMVEIRSDGTRTIARGALEDAKNNETAQLKAEGRTPQELAFSLAQMLFTLPAFAKKMADKTAAREVPADAGEPIQPKSQPLDQATSRSDRSDR